MQGIVFQNKKIRASSTLSNRTDLPRGKKISLRKKNHALEIPPPPPSPHPGISNGSRLTLFSGIFPYKLGGVETIYNREHEIEEERGTVGLNVTRVVVLCPS